MEHRRQTHPPRESQGNASAARWRTPVATIPAMGVLVGSTMPFSLAYRVISPFTSEGTGPPPSLRSSVRCHSSLLGLVFLVLAAGCWAFRLKRTSGNFLQPPLTSATSQLFYQQHIQKLPELHRDRPPDDVRRKPFQSRKYPFLVPRSRDPVAFALIGRREPCWLRSIVF